MNNIKNFIYTILRYFKHKREDQFLKTNYWKNLENHRISETKLISNRSLLLSELPENAIVAEIGVAEGDFSEEIIKLAKPKKLILIDPWDSRKYGSELYTSVQSRFKDEIDNSTVEIRRGYSNERLSEFPDHYFDWVYIDANHSFPYVMDDLSIASAKVKSNGFICGHDYARWSGIQRFGVVEAVNTFCNTNNWKLTHLTNEPHRHLSFAIKRNE